MKPGPIYPYNTGLNTIIVGPGHQNYNDAKRQHYANNYSPAFGPDPRQIQGFYREWYQEDTGPEDPEVYTLSDTDDGDTVTIDAFDAEAGQATESQIQESAPGTDRVANEGNHSHSIMSLGISSWNWFKNLIVGSPTK